MEMNGQFSHRETFLPEDETSGNGNVSYREILSKRRTETKTKENVLKKNGKKNKTYLKSEV